MSDAELLGNQIREIFEAETGVTGGTFHSKLRSLVALASAPQQAQDIAEASGGAEGGPEEDRIEAAFWRFDARHKGYGQWRQAPMSERDAFKAEMRNALHAEAVRAEMRMVVKGWRKQGPQQAQEAPSDDLRELGKWLNEEPNRPIDRSALARVLAWAQVSAPKQAQAPSLPPQGAEPLAHRLISSGPNAGRVKPEYAAPPQGASSLLPENATEPMQKAMQRAVLLRRSMNDVWLAALSELPAASPPAPAARFLLVAMDDDGCGNPVFCADEKAVRAALAPLLFFFNDKHPLDAENEASIDAHLESLLEDGFLNFEGDPGITLYKLHASPAPGELGAVDAAAGWISVDDRMPEPDSGEVLVWLSGGRCAFDEWHMHREDPTGMSTTHTMEMGLMWRDYEFEDITHWMPLPQPPQQAPSESSAQGSGGEKV